MLSILLETLLSAQIYRAHAWTLLQRLCEAAVVYFDKVYLLQTSFVETLLMPCAVPGAQQTNVEARQIAH